MAKVLVTGGCGYIGSHTLVELLSAGHEPVSIDDNSRSSESVLDGVERITGRRVRNCRVDLRGGALTGDVFREHRDAVAVIHFAAYKTVPESVAKPLLYYDNNVNSLLNVLRSTDESGIPGFIFSSSCSVYGNSRQLPVTEETPFGEAECPYARTKQIGEQVISDFARVSRTGFVSLRYFNPVGAHLSGEIGEVPYGEPDNLVPRITRTAVGELPELVVHGQDYDTRDGTCIRDYVHVSDIARAHVLAIEYLTKSPIADSHSPIAMNLGSGTGTTVLEAITAFERATGSKLNYRVGPRRPGDASAVFSDNRKAGEILAWRPELGIGEMMSTAWRWQQRLSGRRGRP
ncbi:UDP-glucose 4-epimerase GalE [candidate division WOR-3 bacterium]|uniref:UDP-glucose 4-epimerase n=1 Tax=candidate division WOR-3 bacterium TaxID=2052148 RepID=A0A938BTN0_UNCW3|nr:UDP-glucose 4-epimerase GalE [candidate division WOR-3 bacterium]